MRLLRHGKTKGSTDNTTYHPTGWSHVIKYKLLERNTLIDSTCKTIIRYCLRPDTSLTLNTFYLKHVILSK